MDPRYADAVENFRAGRIAAGVPKGRARAMARAYAKRLRAHRAETIAQSEVQQALMDAQRVIWARQQEAGDLSRYAVRVTHTHKDERLCPVCRPEGGRRRSLKAGTKGGPPFHPRCRCWEEIEDQGIVKTDPALWGPAPVAKHLSGLHDQKTHGHRGLTGVIRDAIDAMINDQRPVVSGFGRGLKDVFVKYPALGQHVHAVALTSLSKYPLAGTRYREQGQVQVFLNPIKAQGAVQRLQAKLGTGYRVWGVPEVQGNNAGHIDPHDYAYAVAVHEVGHVAHLQMMAFMHRGGLMDDLRAAGKRGVGMAGVPALTPYAQTSRVEAFAEWFAAHQFGLTGPEHQVPEAFLDTFHQAMGAWFDWDGRQAIAKEVEEMNGREDMDGHEDFEGSIVEWFAARHEEISKKVGSRLDRSPKKNWVEEHGGLPKYIEDIAVALHEKRGMDIGRAIAVAISRVKMWAAGGGGVNPDTRAKAAAAVAAWETMRAQAKAS